MGVTLPVTLQPTFYGTQIDTFTVQHTFFYGNLVKAIFQSALYDTLTHLLQNILPSETALSVNLQSI
jgi:hypothetical protein